MTTPSHSLTASHVEAYQHDGFIVIENVFSSAEIEALRQAESSPEIQTALEEKGIKHQTVHLLELTQRHPALLALARNPIIVGAICSLLGPNVQLQYSKLATKSVAKGAGNSDGIRTSLSIRTATRAPLGIRLSR